MIYALRAKGAEMKNRETVLSDVLNTDLFKIKKLAYTAEQDKKVTFDITVQGKTLNVYADCDSEMFLESFSLTFAQPFKADDVVFVNGFQSWTDSKEYFTTEKMYSPAPLMRTILYSGLGQKLGLSGAGDYNIFPFKPSKGVFYGFSYGYIRNKNDVRIFGSVSERTGYTIWVFDAVKNEVTAHKDLKGKTFAKGRNLVASICMISADYETAFDEYFSVMQIKKQDAPLKRGYTSWYNYYGNIDEQTVLRDLEAFSKIPCDKEIFQIDDGYQKAIGDWLNCKQTFSGGMKNIAEKIHAKGLNAGIWLAPFAVTKNCFIFKEHPDWLVKDAKGKPFKAGANWGGFYALDIYNKEAREYIRHFFDVILNDWGYDLVKLDFLYAAAMLPAYGKTRGEIMCDAMDLLRECVGEKLILGCGVPLAPAFGKVDYCRIGPDISLKWFKNNYDSREGVSTSHAIVNTVFRRHLDGRAFGNDPDVFLLRNGNIDMTFKQKANLAKINKLFGKVLFTSDCVSEYGEIQKQTLLSTFDGKRAKITKAEFVSPDVLTVEYDEGEGLRKITVNVYKGSFD